MSERRGGFVYLISNSHNTVLYAGVTSELKERIYEHKVKFYPKGFSAKYNCNKIVWFEFLPSIEEAIWREKQIKGGSRRVKELLVNSKNPEWKDLWDDIQDL
ncbi:MAG: GIY-YIG nuclease family protein [Ginsengibacter sp.]